VTAAVAAFSLTGTSHRFTPTADPKPAVTFGPPLTYVPPTASAAQQARTAAPKPRKPAPAKSKAAPTPASAPPAVLSVPPPVQPSTPPPTREKAPAPVKKHTPPAHHRTHPAPRPTPRPTPTPKPTPKPTPTGTLSAFPGGGTLVVEPGGAAQVQLTAAGGSVNWSVTVANDPDGAVSVSPASGTLTPGDPSATVTVTVSQYLDCDQGCPTVTISPGGEVYTIWTGHRKHHHRRHDQNSNSAPAAAVVSATSQLYLTETRRITISQTRS
jgi:hypothetical protein